MTITTLVFTANVQVDGVSSGEREIVVRDDGHAVTITSNPYESDVLPSAIAFGTPAEVATMREAIRLFCQQHHTVRDRERVTPWLPVDRGPATHLPGPLAS